MEKSKSYLNKYIILILIGMILILSYIATIWTNDVWYVILTVFVTIGGGFFCSAVISLIIDCNNRKEMKNKIAVQRKAILSLIQLEIDFIVPHELKYLSEYNSLLSKNRKTTQKDLSLDETITEIICTIEEIMSKGSDNEQCNQVNNENLLAYVDKRRALAFNNILPNYKQLFKYVSTYLIDSSLFIVSELFNEEQIKNFKLICIYIGEIINYSKDGTIDVVLEYKKIFYEFLQQKATFLYLNLGNEAT